MPKSYCACLLLLLVVAACGNQDKPPAHSISLLDAGGSGDIGDADTNNLGGSGGAAGGPTNAGGTGLGGPVGACSPNATPGQLQILAGVNLDADARFAAVTPDELTLVWIVPSSATAAIYVADRQNVSSNFGSPQVVSGVPIADQTLALSSDGLTIAYVVAPDNRSIATVSRLDRTSAFQFPDPSSGNEFASFNTAAALPSGETYVHPLYGSYATDFYYGRMSASGSVTWYVTSRVSSDDPLLPGGALRNRQ